MADATDDEIANELASSTPDGDPTGSSIQVGLMAPDSQVALDGSTPKSPAPTPGAGIAPAVLAKVGGSYTGPTEAGKKYAAGMMGNVERRTDAYAAQDQARINGELSDNQKAYGKAEEAAGQEGQAAKDFAARDQELQQRVIDFNRHAALLEERAAGEAKAERAKFLSAYQEQLAGVKALAMQSGNPLSQLNGGERMGLIGAQFAQGFLAARGINIDVTGQVDRWVDRSIKEHQMKVQNARASAEDQLHLYEIARQNSQDDWEARQRYRGFVIQGLQTAITANANRFQSDIAVARANESVAKLQIDANTTARDIGDRHEQRVLQRYQAEIQAAHVQGQLAIESQKLQLERDKMNAAKGAAAPFYVADPEKRVVVGPDGKQHIIQVRTKMVNPNLGKEQQEYLSKKASDASDAEGDYQDKLGRLIEARKKVSDEWGAASRIGRKVGREDEAWQEYQNAKTDFVNTVIYKRSGKQINDSEFERFFGMVPDQKLLQKGSSDKLLNQMQEVGRKEYQRLTDDPNYIDVPDQVQATDPKTGKTVIMRNPDKYHEVSDVEPGLAALHRAQSSADAGTGTTPDSVSADLENAEQPTGKLTKATSGWEKLMGAGGQSMPLEATFVDDIVKGVVHPAHYRQGNYGEHTLPDDDTTLQSDSLQALQRLANEPSQTGTYARQWLQYIESDPAKARELVLGPADESNLKADVPRGVPRSFRK